MKKQFVRLCLIALALVLAIPAGGIFAQGDDGLVFQEGTVATDSAMAIRAEAGLRAEVLTTVEPGEVVEVLEVGDTWTYVRYGDVEGWTFTRDLDIYNVMLDLIGTVDNDSALAVRAEPALSGDVLTTVPTGSVVGVMMVDGNWAMVYTGDYLGWAFAADLALSEPTDAVNLVRSQAVASTDSAVAVRVEPSIRAEALGVIEDGESANVLAYDDSGLFAYIMTGELSGWAFAADFVIEPRATGLGAIAAGPANFRDAPDGSALTQLSFGSPLYILGRSEDGEWLNVRYTGGGVFIDGEEALNAIGWVSTALVETDADIESLPVTE